MSRTIVAIDQGTTSTRAILFDEAAAVIATEQVELPNHYPQHGWVEHEAEDIWNTTVEVVRKLLDGRPAPAAIGITNQRETTIVWDRATGEPIHRAIVWQDRRTAANCAKLRADGHEELVTARSGLLVDPYFSATKAAWILDAVPGARDRAEAGELAFGTVDSFLLWRLTRGKVHATDATNASRTMLFDIHRQRWCPELCALFGVPEAMLPEVRDCAGDFGTTALFGAPIPIRGVAGDQQAALIGQRCFAAGDAKATYGTGCFLLLNCGAEAERPEGRLLTTVAYRMGGETSYAVEGSIFVAGAAVKWLRDALGVIASADETEALAAGLDDNGGVYLVPAFAGLGAPHWAPDARGLIAGLTLGAGRAQLARAALEAVAYQTHDLIAAASPLETLRIDGGMAANGWLCQFLADLLGVTVERPDSLEATALGAAYLAGIGAGVWDGFAGVERLERRVDRFEPRMGDEERERLLTGWRGALEKALA